MLGDSGHIADTATVGPLPLVLHGAGGGVRVSGHHRAQPSLQETQHSQDAGLGQKYSDTENARNLVYEGSKAGIIWTRLNVTVNHSC